MVDSPAVRLRAQRAVNTLDVGGRTLILDLDDGADLETEGNADWSEPYIVLGYDEVTLEVGFTAGNADGFRIGVQVGSLRNDDDTLWYDLFDDTGSGVLARRVYAFDPSADARVAFTFRCAFPYVRFKLWGQGADLTGSRAMTWAVRHMLA